MSQPMTVYQNRILESRTFNSSESIDSSMLLKINDSDLIYSTTLNLFNLLIKDNYK